MSWKPLSLKQIKIELKTSQVFKKKEDDVGFEVYYLNNIKVTHEIYKKRILNAELKNHLNSERKGKDFQVLFKFPDGYPKKPPTVTFIGKILHPHVFKRTGIVHKNIFSTN